MPIKLELDKLVMIIAGLFELRKVKNNKMAEG